MKASLFLIPLIFFYSCKNKTEKTTPTIAPISESIYASGIIKSKDQYMAFATVNGVINAIYVSEGDSVKTGTPILSISNETQKLIEENAELAAQFSDFNANQDKLNEAKEFVDLAKSKLKNDSVLYTRQKDLWQQQVGTQFDFEQRQLAYQNSKAAYYSAIVKYKDLRKQLDFASSQSKKNLQISKTQEGDFTVKSKIGGVVYDILKSKGEIVGLQTPLAVIGDAHHFILEMQVDEYDIFKITNGLQVLVTMDSYKGQVFEAKVTKIYPIMDERSKTFLVEAEFSNGPKILYPNITFEANIVLKTKNNTLLIPRNYLLNDSTVIKSNGTKVQIKTGLKDYQKVEVLSGLTSNDELIKPKE